MTPPVFVALNDSGAALSRRLMSDIAGAELHGYAPRVSDSDVPFERVQDHLRAIFSDGRPMVAIMSTGIVVRAIGALAMDKRREAPVICMNDTGSSVVPLLGGHSGGNRLAAQLASKLGVAAAITTGGDSRFGLALDDPPPGWRCSNVDAAKPVMAALLADEPVKLINDSSIDEAWLDGLDGTFDDGGSLSIVISEQAATDPEQFTLHPQTHVAGVGCERGVGSEEVISLITESLASKNIAPQSLAALATIDIKEDETALRQAAAHFGVPLRLFTAAELEAETPRVTEPSDYVFETVGCHSVSEAAALASAGPDSGLAVPKMKSARATCAIARSPQIIDPSSTGRAAGHLSIVGIGPGRADWRAPEATSAIACATDLVGYRLYLDLLGGLTEGKIRHDYDLGEETDRVAHALNLAAVGKQVALVSSGDAGIYAMASLAFELIDQGENDAWKRLAVEVVPGISALQAGAARSGAPLGHDFCAISLSDLMTPWEVIENRLAKAGEGDFVIALYNPVSKRRRDQFGIAKDILLKSRPGEAPVLLARNLGREDEALTLTTLNDVHADIIDMLTVVIIGSSETRVIDRADGSFHLYTPRGYGDKKK